MTTDDRWKAGEYGAWGGVVHVAKKAGGKPEAIEREDSA